MNFQAISNSSFEPDSKPWESWKTKLHPGYVIWCSISCRPLCCYACEQAWHPYAHHLHYHLTHLNWWHQMNHRLFELITCKKLNGQRKHKTWTDLPSLSYMMGSVLFAIPQTFSRMVVFPALALPMTRMRKCGHKYCSLSNLTSVSSVSDCVHQRMIMQRYHIGLLNGNALSSITGNRALDSEMEQEWCCTDAADARLGGEYEKELKRVMIWMYLAWELKKQE